MKSDRRFQPNWEMDGDGVLLSSLSDSLGSLASFGSLSASPGGGNSIDSKAEPIDNKIEQAMDLVKSHLLLAVREEVDVLKASITKLVEKISALERENEVLKTNASPEVLAQLEESPAMAMAGSTPTATPQTGWPQQQQSGH